MDGDIFARFRSAESRKLGKQNCSDSFQICNLLTSWVPGWRSISILDGFSASSRTSMQMSFKFLGNFDEFLLQRVLHWFPCKMKNHKSCRMSNLSWTLELILRQLVVLMGTSNTENMKF